MKAVFMTGDEKNLAGVYKTVREKLTAELDFISPITSAAQLEEERKKNCVTSGSYSRHGECSALTRRRYGNIS